MSFKQFEALVKLIDDESSDIQSLIEKSIHQFYFSLTPSEWLSVANKQKKSIKKRLDQWYKKLNIYYSDFLFRLWSGMLEPKDFKLLDKLKVKGIEIKYDSSVEYMLYLLSKELTPYLCYETFDGLIEDIADKVPRQFIENSTVLEQARYFSWLFYKWDKFYSTIDDLFGLCFDPYNVLKEHKGSGFAIAMIMISVAEKLGLEWFVVGDHDYNASYVVMPVDKEMSVQPLLLNTSTGVILNQIPQIIGDDLVKLFSIAERRTLSAYFFLSAYAKYKEDFGGSHISLSKKVNLLKQKLNLNF